jgi:hypothetical protein
VLGLWCEPASLRESEQVSVTASHQKVTMQGPSSPPIVMTRATRMMAGLVAPIGDQSPTLNDNLRKTNVPCRGTVSIHRGVADAPFRQAIASRRNLLPVTKLHLVIVHSTTRIQRGNEERGSITTMNPTDSAWNLHLVVWVPSCRRLGPCTTPACRRDGLGRTKQPPAEGTHRLRHGQC